MIQRCRREKNYKHVRVHPAWRKFSNFLRDMGECPRGLTLDRENPFGHYEPRNARWAAAAAQSRNQRRTIYVKIGGSKRLLIDYCRDHGLVYRTMVHRIKKQGMTPEEAVRLTHHPHAQVVTFRGETLTLIEWAKRLDMTVEALFYRLKKGWGVRRTLTTPRRPN